MQLFTKISEFQFIYVKRVQLQSSKIERTIKKEFLLNNSIKCIIMYLYLCNLC